MMTLAKNRRSLVAAAALTVAAVLLAGCATAGAAPAPAPATVDEAGPIILQSNLTGPQEVAVKALVDDFNALGKGKVTVNTLPTQDLTVLNSPNPPDVLTWFAGQATKTLADKGLLLDLSSVMAQHEKDFSPAVRELSKADDGSTVLIPTNYYSWGVYYYKSNFEKLGLTPPKTWEDFLKVAASAKKQGQAPLTMGLSDNAWLADSWFDYLDVRINGADFHRALLAGKKKFDSPEVRDVFAKFKEVLPYFDPNMLGTSQNQALADFGSGKVTMFLLAAGYAPYLPKDRADDLAFFPFPVIDASVQTAEEGPVDGYIASAKTKKPNLVKKFMDYVARPEVQAKYNKVLGFIPTNTASKLELTPLVAQGREMLEGAHDVTQFFNRDAGNEYEPTAEAALPRFIAHPDQLDQILQDWDAAWAKVTVTN